MQESKQETQFRIGGVYRDKKGHLLHLRNPIDGAAGKRFEKKWGEPGVEVFRVCEITGEIASYNDGWRMLLTGRYHEHQRAPDSPYHLIPGELHQVNGQWLPLDDSEDDGEHADPTGDVADMRDSPNAAMIARDNTDAAVHYANKRAFIAKMAQVVADRPTTKPPIAGLTRVSAQDHRVGGWGFVR